jgi:hypothetical protein
MDSVVLMAPSYATTIAGALSDLEQRLYARYLNNWKLRIERESPGVWRCHWDILTDSGEIVGGGSESFTVNV